MTKINSTQYICKTESVYLAGPTVLGHSWSSKKHTNVNLKLT
ncbi:hypothetical protein BVRB_5g116870 [Beta vulgaris subsp. vulgaris]|nr:hypothetical protein BVRB_5g116870 [Beta vulgaris subsp. vulgaris]